MQQTKQILFLTFDGINDPLGQSQILPYLVGLSDQGNAIHLVSLEKSGLNTKHPGLVSGITWHPLRYFMTPPILSSIMNLIFMYKKSLQVIKKNKVGIIHVRSYLPMLVALRLKKKFDLKVIFDMRGFWPDERVEGQLWDIKNQLYSTIYKYFKQQELNFVSNSDHIISLTHSGKKVLVKDFNVPEGKITVIPTAVDLEHFNPGLTSTNLANLQRENLEINESDYVLTYFGSLGTWYLLDEMLVFFKSILTKLPEAKFLIITKDRSIIEKLLSREYSYLKKSVIVTSGKREEMPTLLAIANASIFFIKPSYSKKASNATKMGESLAMDLPIITNAGWGDVEDILKDKNIGTLVQSFDESSYSKAINEIISKDWAENHRRRYAEDHISLNDAVSSYSVVYNSLLSTST